MESTAYEVLILPALLATCGGIVVGVIVLFVINAVETLTGCMAILARSLKESLQAIDHFPRRVRRPVVHEMGSVRKGLNSRGVSSSIRGVLSH